MMLVLVTGRADPALHLCSSNRFGYGLFSSGLSTVQRQGTLGVHMLTTVCCGNIPMLVLMTWLWIYMQYETVVVIVAFIASFVCLTLSLVFILVPWLRFWSLKELPFAISIRWSVNGKESPKGGRDALKDPMRRTGRRERLGIELMKILEPHAIEVEFLSSMRRDNGCWVYGVFRGPSHLSFPSFKNTTPCFREAVMNAFGYEKELGFSSWQFDVAVAQDSYEVVYKLTRMGLDERLLNRIEMNFVMDSAAVPPHSQRTDGYAPNIVVTSPSMETGAVPMTTSGYPTNTSRNAEPEEEEDGNYLALGSPAQDQRDQKEEEPPTMTASATGTGAGAAAMPDSDSPPASDVEMAELATPLQAIPSTSRDSKGDELSKGNELTKDDENEDDDVVNEIMSSSTAGGPTAGGGAVAGGLAVGHQPEVSQHSQLLPDHVDLEHLDDDLDGLFEDSVNLDVAED